MLYKQANQTGGQVHGQWEDDTRVNPYVVLMFSQFFYIRNMRCRKKRLKCQKKRQTSEKVIKI